MAFHTEKERTTSTPYVLIDEEKSYMRLEGKCFHEKVVDFFKEVNDWLDNYLTTDFSVFTFDCALDYFNSSTTKLLHNILLKLDKHASPQKKIVVNWLTTADNEIIVECGEDFQEDVSNIEFNMVLK